ncbi:MAG: sigma-54 dependent transcriptional regulator [Candidatus Sumerlaeaceae bacterium]|nr:sigma-54 dependent transcriptional regulator [Candidatus Sumerlaeaceae bacterium]
MMETASAQPGETTRQAPSVALTPVLVLDDNALTLQTIDRILRHKGACEVRLVHSVAQARDALLEMTPDVALVDVYLQGENGLHFVRELRGVLPELGIIVFSGDDTATLAAQAVECGADSFLSKPLTAAALTLTVEKLAELARERRKARALEAELERNVLDTVFPDILTHSDAMKAVLRLVRKVAARDLAVLVCGESGTGKELVALAIHQNSRRRRGPFIELNCGALPPNLVESELFGHEKGAFTGAVASRAGRMEQADTGTLFLDEVGELPLDMQPKLLRALQEKRFTRVGGNQTIGSDFRLISATNRDLVEEVRRGRFREDLFYRVGVFPIRLPPLRERPEDLDLLLTHFLRREGISQPHLTSGARAILRDYRWPGNVRELLNFAQAITLMCEDGTITEDCVRHYFGSRLELTGRTDTPPPSDTHRPVRKLADLEREEILYALRCFKGNVSEAARALGMGRATLYKYLRANGIQPTQP